MVNDELSLSERLRLVRSQPPAEPADVDEDDDSPGYRAFALVRSPRQQVFMVEFRFKGGNSLALGYAWLRHSTFDRSGVITLEFGRDRITIRGRHLEPLFAGILTHRVRWVWEADRPTADLVEAGEPVVESITVGEPAPPPRR